MEIPIEAQEEIVQILHEAPDGWHSDEDHLPMVREAIHNVMDEYRDESRPMMELDGMVAVRMDAFAGFESERHYRPGELEEI